MEIKYLVVCSGGGFAFIDKETYLEGRSSEDLPNFFRKNLTAKEAVREMGNGSSIPYNWLSLKASIN